MADDHADMVNLETLDEHSMMDNLRRRFDRGEVYTTCGRIVVSVNPFRWLPLYGEHLVEQYHAAEDPFATLPPHVYSIVHSALNEIAVQSSRDSPTEISFSDDGTHTGLHADIMGKMAVDSPMGVSADDSGLLTSWNSSGFAMEWEWARGRPRARDLFHAS